MLKCFGKQGARLYSIVAFLFAFGGMAAYTVIIGDTVPVVIRAILGITGDSSATKSLSFYAFITDRRVAVVVIVA